MKQGWHQLQPYLSVTSPPPILNPTLRTMKFEGHTRRLFPPVNSPILLLAFNSPRLGVYAFALFLFLAR